MQARSGEARTPAFAPGTGTRALGEPAEASLSPRAAAISAVADPGERFFGYFLVATRKYLAFGCENPIRITAGRRHHWVTFA